MTDLMRRSVARAVLEVVLCPVAHLAMPRNSGRSSKCSLPTSRRLRPRVKTVVVPEIDHGLVGVPSLWMAMLADTGVRPYL
jgi:hypothetical protein